MPGWRNPVTRQNLGETRDLVSARNLGFESLSRRTVDQMEESDMLDIVKNLSTKLPKFKDGRINYSKSTIAPVVNSFVKYKDKILILRRGEKSLPIKECGMEFQDT